jgi:hypothetical protein
VAIFHAREIAAQKSGAFFDVALGHAFLKAVVSDGFADVHKELRLPSRSDRSWTA